MSLSKKLAALRRYANALLARREEDLNAYVRAPLYPRSVLYALSTLFGISAMLGLD